MNRASECEILAVTGEKYLELRHLFYRCPLKSLILSFDV